MANSSGQLAVITGASSGIGLELARCCLKDGFDVVIASDTSEIETAAAELRSEGGRVTAVQADLSTLAGVDQLYREVSALGRPVDALLANAGRGLGKAFLDQDFEEIREVIDLNVTGTLYLLQRFGRDMRARNKGRILITGSIGALMPGAFQAVYNGTKALIVNFAYALGNELKDTDVTVTVLMPGPTETDFFEVADMMDTKVGTDKKASAADVAQEGFAAMMKGSTHVVSDVGAKMMAAMAHVTPWSMLAEQHRKLAEPGTAKQ